MTQKTAEKGETIATPEQEDKNKRKQDNKPAPQALTTANWTPDIVATSIAAFLGLTLAPIIGLMLAFLPGSAALIFILILLFIIAAVFAFVCRHMELSGYRLFHQAYFLMIPTTVTAFILALAIVAVSQTVNGALSKATHFGSMIGFSASLPSFNPGATPQSLLLATVIIMVVMLLPAIIQGRKDLKFWWFLPLMIPLAVCLITYYLVGLTTLI